MYTNIVSTIRLRVWLSVHTLSVRAYQRLFVVSVYMDVCVFVKLNMHECASQSVCASATVSTPLGLSTKPAQRQMGNFLRGKGKKIWSGSKKQQDVCLSLLFLKTDRYRDVEIFTDCERENKRRQPDNKRKEREGDSLRHFFSTLFYPSPLTLRFWRIRSPLSLYSILIKGLVFIPSFPHQRPKLCLS